VRSTKGTAASIQRIERLDGRSQFHSLFLRVASASSSDRSSGRPSLGPASPSGAATVRFAFAFANAALFTAYIVFAHRVARRSTMGGVDGLAAAMMFGAQPSSCQLSQFQQRATSRTGSESSSRSRRTLTPPQARVSRSGKRIHASNVGPEV
jgi:hypothetical protein